MKSVGLLRTMIAISTLLVCSMASRRAVAFYPEEHSGLTKFAFDILQEMYPEALKHCLEIDGKDSLIRNMAYENIEYVPAKPPANAELVDRIAWEALAPDCYRDLELVDVDLGRDDPHNSGTWENRDEATYSTKDDPLVGTLFELFGYVHSNYTAFNHFINIGSYGKSKFDDYDGYSHEFIKEYGHEYQVDAKFLGKGLDDGIVWYYNDEYVHASGQQWYANCSPSVTHYSYPKKYPTRDKELEARFPLAKSIGSEDCGIPYSVFTPVDNMAKYWYSRFLETEDPLDLGPVMHAIGDASIPHHSAGYLGNWHQYYETEIAEDVRAVIDSAADRQEIMVLVEKWNRAHGDPPQSLAPSDYDRTPALNWSIDNLVTWVALNAYQQYMHDYEPHFRSKKDGVVFRDKAKELVKLVTAVKVLVLKKALSEQ